MLEQLHACVHADIARAPGPSWKCRGTPPCALQVHRNLDPALHPHEKAVEYTRALNAAKLQRVFAKPFLASLPHTDGVTCLARSPTHLNSLVGGAKSGSLRFHRVPLRGVTARCSR
jgi:DDB1- and CUL4-associated factor 13